MSSCNRNNHEKSESSFVNFSNMLLKTFTLLIVIILIFSIKNKLITEGVTLFYTAIFVVIATILLTILGLMDSYLYNNVIIGIGVALGFQLMNFNK